MPNDATERVRSDWNDLATGWFAQRESLFAASRPVHEWLVAHVDPQPGQHILEIAAGPGDTGFIAARKLGNGRLLSTDLSPLMVDAARQRSAELGIANVDHRVLDAQAMDLADATFDGVICRWAFMLMPDPAAALRECRRVLKPGGRLAFAVFTGPDENPFASLPARVFREAGHLPQPTDGWQPGILALGDRTRLQTLLDSAGFASTSLDRVGMTWTFANADEYWTFLVEVTAFGPLVRALPDAARNAVRVTIDQRLVAFTRDGRIELPARCWCGLAVA
jgi:SAM-dependent methyltransferase